jgi:hypothetical protein
MLKINQKWGVLEYNQAYIIYNFSIFYTLKIHQLIMKEISIHQIILARTHLLGYFNPKMILICLARL